MQGFLLKDEYPVWLKKNAEMINLCCTYSADIDVALPFLVFMCSIS
jgi:hypothetical protein